MTTVRTEEVQHVLEIAVRNSYKAKDKDSRNEAIINQCLKLLDKDYKFSVVSNPNGELCNHYPSRIPVLEYACPNINGEKDGAVESLYNVLEIKELFNKARFARCRARFAVPVILFEGKHICRGATISGGAEIYGRSSFDFFFSGGESIPVPNDEGNSASGEQSTNEWQLFNRIRGQDIKLLKMFSVGYIADLMVEKKKVKFGMNVTSSEKVDKERRYADFTILSIPYPGCEFFRQWRDSGYVAEGMLFDWRQGHVDAWLDLPGNLSPPPGVDWTKYKSWDLVRLTQNYLKLLLHYIKFGESGLLLHCISGWDRTPLYIALLRLSLWADGAAHASLSPLEIVYYTVAYDWYLYGHNFPDRLDKGEDIFFFCFYFLKYMTSEEFSIHRRASLTSGPQMPPSSNIQADEQLTVDSLRLTCSYKTSSPVAMPTAAHASRAMGSEFKVCDSPQCGSWEFVSGSIRGSGSSSSSCSHSSEHNSGSDAATAGSFDPKEDTPRKQKLEAARQIFLSIYVPFMGLRSPEAEAGGLSSFLGNFAEKMGIKQSRSSVI